MASTALTIQDHQGHRGHRQPGRNPALPTLCLHCSTGSSRQWRSLSMALGESRRVIAPDLLGYGDNPPWPRNRTLGLETEVQRLTPLLASAARPVDVVAHSFGAAVAVKLALDNPDKVRSLSLYEPVLFGLLQQDADSGPALLEIYKLTVRIDRSLNHGDADTAARRFIDFWSGDGAWASMPEGRRQSVRACIGKVRADFDALLADETSLSELARVDIPVLCLSGEQSPAATRRIAGLLTATFPRATSKRFEEAGHMGPLTHARQVNASIENFFKSLPVQSAVRVPYAPVTARAA